MDSDNQPQGIDWAAIAKLDAAERDARVAAAYSAAADLPDDARRAVIARSIEVIYALPDPELRAMTEARLRAWLSLPADKAPLVGESYESVMDGMPAAIAMRRVTVVQAVAHRLSGDELARLQELVPRVLGDSHSLSAVTVRGTAPARPWWKVWARA